MKLWQKIFLCALILILIAIDVTSVMLVSNSHRLMVEREQQRSVAEHNYLSASIVNNVVYERMKNNKLILDADSVHLVMEKITSEQINNNTGIAIYSGNAVINTVNADIMEQSQALREAVSNTEDYCVEISQWQDGYYMMVGSQMELEGESYQVFTVSDITEIFLLRGQQIQFAQVMSLVCAIVIALIMLLTVIKLLAPLDNINDTTRQIAKGQYHKRLPEKGGIEFRELSHNMNLMAESVEQNVERLEKVAEDRKIFIANLAHEMKTPLTSILGFADILRVKRVMSEEERRDYAGVIVEETKRLRSLSGKLMEIITVGNTQMEFKSVSLYEMVSEVYLALTPILNKSGISLLCEPIECKIRVDVELFKSLLYNLIENAVKASASGQQVHVVCKEETQMVLIAVIDHGIGMREEDIKKVTEPFYMVDKSRSRKAGGAGLGLALCTEIVKLHHARMKIKSRLGEGTTVIIAMPKEAES